MGSSRDQIRAADADRELYAQRLREALEEGRLGLTEMDERLQQVYAAKTFGDLDRTVADLPGTVPSQRAQVAPAGAGSASPTFSPAQVPPSRHEENPRMPRWLAFLWRLWLVVFMVNLVIWFVASVMTGSLIHPWWVWVAGPWGAVNVGLMILFPPSRQRRQGGSA